uniref:NADH dehydrogenase subunit 6 n=1 Tax=Haedus sp. TaxID=2931292 RepID=A0A8T9ZXQ3_9HEMI|nr:NADH dehydrogenase subunit 6 [Haedus sp.]
MILTFSMILSLIFLCSSTALSMIFTLILQTLTFMMIMFMLVSTYWYSYLLFLTMISGLMIMFMYLATLMIDQKFKFSLKITSLSLMMYICTLMFPPKLLLNPSWENVWSENIDMTKLYSSKMIAPTLMMITFLFIIMIVISHLINTEDGPLRMGSPSY